MSSTVNDPAPPAAPGAAEADALQAARQGAGRPGPALHHLALRESASELQTLVDKAGPLAGFGYEIALLRRYLTLAQAGWRWLLVKVDDAEHAAAACELARACGATLAVHYRSLTAEELI